MDLVPGRLDTVLTKGITKIDTEKLIWVGEIPGRSTSMTMLIDGDKVSGHLVVDQEVYSVIQLSGNRHVVGANDLGAIRQGEPKRGGREPRPSVRKGEVSGTPTIDVLLVYNASAANLADIEAEALLAETEGNAVLANSGINAAYDIVAVEQISYAQGRDTFESCGSGLGK